MRAGHHIPGQYVLYGADRSKTVGGGAHQAHCYQILLDKRASGHRRSESSTFGDEEDVCEHADEATARDTIPREEGRDNRVERCCSNLVVYSSSTR